MQTSSRIDAQDASTVNRFLTAASVAGATLPPDLRAALDAEATLAAWLAETRRERDAIDTGAAMNATVADLVAAAAAGRRPDGFGAAVAEAEARVRVLEVEALLLTQAHDEAAVEVLRAMRRDVLIAESLRPVHDAILAEAADVAPVLRGVPVDDAEAMLAAPSKVQAARGRLLALHERYAAVRAAWSAIVPADARDSEYSSLRRPEAAWGSRWHQRLYQGGGPVRLPWPTEPLAHLAWLVGAGVAAEPWLPTPAEVEAAERAAVERDRSIRPSEARVAVGA